MKRAVFTVAILAILLCSCKKQVAFEVKSSGFRCDAHIEYNETELDAELLVGENGIFCAEVTNPAALEGMKLEWSGETVSVSYLGIKKEVDAKSVPYFNYARLIRSILGDISNKVSATAAGKGYTYDGTSECGNYKIEFRADGFPIKISLPAANLEVTLSNFEYLS